MADRQKLTEVTCLRAGGLRAAMARHDRDGVITPSERRDEHRRAAVLSVIAEVLDYLRCEAEFREKAGPFARPYPALVRKRRAVERLLDEVMPWWRKSGFLTELEAEDEGRGAGRGALPEPVQLPVRGLVLVKARRRTRQAGPDRVRQMMVVVTNGRDSR